MSFIDGNYLQGIFGRWRIIDFYEGFLGQRLVKQTVNFDDPSSYHLYFGDSSGTPGTLITFFYFGNIPQGTHGVGEVSRIAYGIPESAKKFRLSLPLRAQFLRMRL